MFGCLVRDSMYHAVGRNHDRGNARTLIEGVAIGIDVTNRRLGVIVKTIGFIVGDDNGALRTIGAVGDGVDGVPQKSFTDLRVGVTGVIVVAGVSCLDCRAGRAGNQAIKGAVTAADIIDSATSSAGQRADAERVEEVAEALHVRRGFVRVVGFIAEVLRGIVVGDVSGVSGYPTGVCRLVIVAFFVPGPRYRARGT